MQYNEETRFQSGWERGEGSHTPSERDKSRTIILIPMSSSQVQNDRTCYYYNPFPVFPHWGKIFDLVTPPPHCLSVLSLPIPSNWHPLARERRSVRSSVRTFVVILYPYVLCVCVSPERKTVSKSSFCPSHADPPVRFIELPPATTDLLALIFLSLLFPFPLFLPPCALFVSRLRAGRWSLCLSPGLIPVSLIGRTRRSQLIGADSRPQQRKKTLPSSSPPFPDGRLTHLSHAMLLRFECRKGGTNAQDGDIDFQSARPTPTFQGDGGTRRGAGHR